LDPVQDLPDQRVHVWEFRTDVHRPPRYVQHQTQVLAGKHPDSSWGHRIPLLAHAAVYQTYQVSVPHIHRQRVVQLILRRLPQVVLGVCRHQFGLHNRSLHEDARAHHLGHCTEHAQ